jgi:hypothetical protein
MADIDIPFRKFVLKVNILWCRADQWGRPLPMAPQGADYLRCNHELDRGDIYSRPDCNRLRALFRYDHDPLCS